jgi:TetR/AcrR family transcriptional regulator, transcriptional repressor of bet genes
MSPGAQAEGAQRARRGRPSTEVLKAEGYAGLSIAKVAARAGENKALISYHFGSKQGLVSAAGSELGRTITEEILDGLEGAESGEEVVRGAADALWDLMDRDERLPRVYFDLNAVSVVEDDVRQVMREVKAAWREVLSELLGREDDAAAVFVIAGLEGLALERIERGETEDLREAREIFVRAAAAQLDR